MDDDFEHVTSNISPEVALASVDMFFTNEIVRIIDPHTGSVLWEADGAPTLRQSQL